MPRRNRVDGWTAERQRAFIEALAATGSPRRAAALMGKSSYGAEQLRRAPGAESFAAAWDRAIAMAEGTGRARIQAGLEAARAEGAAWALPPAPWKRAATRTPAPSRSPAPRLEEDSDEAKLELLDTLIGKYMLKMDREREARLSGRIAEADFLIRQVTVLEVMLDLSSGDALAALEAARPGGNDFMHIAETPLSFLLDEARRAHWEACGDPPRPNRPVDWLEEEEDGYITEPAGSIQVRPDMSFAEQEAELERRYAQAAREQVAWEAEARAAVQRLASDRQSDPAS
ncbi:hypothetical protein SCH01S_39_01360 [Sphingomonas changbaiensis NBRC 104936]|uniref:Terminase small subunit n=1 Tax=Sphingomonas changbaiensis NBRC 104936 TaxID=1219043 RepID=A0A0E9MQW9_9SPHN|nr:hypothetical protein [Sphingomonas changbaiensis]GAO39851.1 hypothetical protein SCH01S_39_01360 [Sphingomonas changbaiensis NBRC 104936]